MDRMVRCYAKGHTGDWEAICLDLDIAVQGESFEDVFSRYPSSGSVPTVPTVTSQEKRGTPAGQSVPDSEGRNTSSVTSQQERDTSGVRETPGKMANVTDGTLGTLGTLHRGPQSYEEMERLAIQEEPTT